MIHDVRWTIKKITQRLQLVDSLVYRKRQPLGDFRYTELEGPLAEQPVGLDVDDSDWTELSPNSHWGGRFVDFAMRNEFSVPADWDPGLPVALYLPIGEAGDFSHPEALVYVDGERYGTTDRHHQEVMLPEKWRDGAVRKLSLHGWTGLLGWGMIGAPDETDKGLFMYESAVVLIDQPTRDFVAAARVALGVAENTDENIPVRNKLLNALDDAFKLLDLREPVGSDAFYASVPAAYAVLREGIQDAGASSGRRHRRQRPCPHRCGLAVDAGPHARQVRAHLHHRHAPDGAVPRLPLHPEPAPTLRLSAPGLSRSL